MFTQAIYTVQCDNQQAFLNALEEAKKMNPSLVVISTSFHQRSMYNQNTGGYEYPGDFTGQITMGTIRTRNNQIELNSVVPAVEPDLYDDIV